MSPVQDAMLYAWGAWVRRVWVVRDQDGTRAEIRRVVREMRRLRYGVARARYRPRLERS